MKEALRQETLLVSQGYIFAAHLDNPSRMKIFESVMATQVTNAAVTSLVWPRQRLFTYVWTFLVWSQPWTSGRTAAHFP